MCYMLKGRASDQHFGLSLGGPLGSPPTLRGEQRGQPPGPPGSHQDQINCSLRPSRPPQCVRTACWSNVSSRKPSEDTRSFGLMLRDRNTQPLRHTAVGELAQHQRDWRPGGATPVLDPRVNMCRFRRRNPGADFLPSSFSDCFQQMILPRVKM